MATYLQGVTDYIPQFQPFQPDLNFYNNVLQTKQTQYDSNYKQLNQVYGQYLYADLTHGENIQRKEELLKNIDVSLKKVSGLDLSLEQNVTQAVQVFKPFYEDKYLMKDMAWTKNYSNQKGRAEGLKNSLDDKQRAMYWDDGVAALDYKREEFKEASLGDTLNLESPTYTNYVNVQDKALKLAKDSDLSIESVDFSPDGKWIVKTKNGQQLEEPLSKLFEASLGSDPAIMEMYKTQSYVNRKNYAYGNAAQFGGDKNAAELNYLETHFNRLKNEQVVRHTQLQDASIVYTNKIKDLETQIANGNKNPKVAQDLANLKENQGINETVLTRVQKDIDLMSTKSSTATTTTGNTNPFGDLKSLRYKIDNSIASSLMEKDLNEAAHVFAYRNSKQDISANPYAVLDQKHQYDMQNTALRNQGLANAAKIRVKGDKEINMDKQLIESGSHHWDLDPNSDTYGRAIMNEDLMGTKTRNVNTGNVAGPLNARGLSLSVSEEKTQSYALEGVNKMNELIDKYVDLNLMTEEQANRIYNSSSNERTKGMTRKQFAEKLAKNPNYFLNQVVGSKSLADITKRFNYYMKQNSVVSTFNKDIAEWQVVGQRLDEFNSYQKINEKWKKESAKKVESDLINKGYTGAYLMYDEEGNKRSKTDYYKELVNRKILNNSDIKLIQDKLLNTEQRGALGTAISRANSTGMLNKPAAWFLQIANHLDNIGPGNMIDNYIENKLTEKYDYDKVMVAADKAWKSKNIGTPPAIDIVGTKRNAGTGLYTQGITTIGVSHTSPTTPGFHYWNQAKGDFNALDWNDPSSVQTSFTGATPTGLLGSADKGSGESLSRGTNSKTQVLVQAMMQQSENMKSGLKNFTLGSQRIAANNPNKGAMIIYPTKEFIDEYLKGQSEDNPNGVGVINQTDANNMLQYGISIVQNSKNWTNQLYSKGSMTPLEAVIDYSGSYDYNDMYGNGNALIEKNIYGSSKFKVTLNHQMPDPETGQIIKNTSIGYTNSSPDEYLRDIQSNFADINNYIQQ